MTGSDCDLMSAQPYQLLLDALQHEPDAAIFGRPIGEMWPKESLGNYFEVIMRPMDLGTIQRKLGNGTYRHVESLVADIGVVWSNCMTFNLKGTDYHETAVRMKARFDAGVANIQRGLHLSSVGPGAQ